MAGEKLPIVYKGGVRNTLFVLATGAFLLVVGFYAVQEPMSHIIHSRRHMDLPAPVVGWMALPGGVALLGLALVNIMRGCPRLEVNADGIVFTQCWRGTWRMAWRDLDRVELRGNPRADWKNVALIPARGPVMLIGPLSAPARELRAAIEEVAARMKTTAREA